MNYKNTIFPKIKPARATVNNRTPVSSTRQLKNTLITELTKMNEKATHIRTNRNPKPGSTVAHIYNRRLNRGISCNMPPASFSLVRFFWRSNKRSDSLRQLGNNNERNKRNEQKLSSSTKSMLACITIAFPVSSLYPTKPLTPIY